MESIKTKELVVLKFGGMPLKTLESMVSAAEIVRYHIQELRQQVVVVVSAMGNGTNELIVKARELNLNPSMEALDFLMSTGEQQSAAYFSIVLEGLGISAKPFTGGAAGILTDSKFGNGEILGIDPTRLKLALELESTPIIAGFQGMSKDLEITTLGRGSSDVTAVLIAAALNADRCTFYKEASGVMTAHPKYALNATTFPKLSTEDALILCNAGSVLDARSVRAALENNIDLVVKDVRNPVVSGTLISKSFEKKEGVIGLSVSDNISLITVNLRDIPWASTNCLELIEKARISMDIISQPIAENGMTNLSFSIDSKNLHACHAALDTKYNYTVRDDLAKIAIVGNLGEPGIGNRFSRSMAQAEVNIELQSAGDNSITYLIKKSRLKEAVQATHAAFNLDTPKN